MELTFMNRPSTRYLSAACITMALILSGGNSYAAPTVSDIRSRVNIGDESLVDTQAPLAKTETWLIGDFDPRWVELSGEITDTQPENVTLDVYVKIKIGVISTSGRGMDVGVLKKTARWQKEQLIGSRELEFANARKHEFRQKFDVDELFGTLVNQHKWPYILSFRFVVHGRESDGKVVAYKNIILVPDNSSY